MKAFLSGPNEHGTANDYCRHIATETAFPGLRQHASAVEAWADCKGRLALAEAKRILAETERGTWTWPGTPQDYTTRDMAKEALAEALAGFVEG